MSGSIKGEARGRLREMTEFDIACPSEVFGGPPEQLDSLIVATVAPAPTQTRVIAEKIATAVFDHAEMHRGLVKSMIIDEIAAILASDGWRQ